MPDYPQATWDSSQNELMFQVQLKILCSIELLNIS